jgi:hypothetical protein
MRKTAGLVVTDDIEVFYKITGAEKSLNDSLKNAIDTNTDLIVGILKRPVLEVQHLPSYRPIILQESSEVSHC